MQKIKADASQLELKRKESISSLETTDLTGKQSKLAFSTDSDHVEMDTGRTLQQELDAFRSITAKEFTSTGEDITVNNGIPSKVLSASVEGRTVKCIYRVDERSFTGTGASYGSVTISLEALPLLNSSKYTLCLVVTQNSLNYDYLANNPVADSAFNTKCVIPKGETGIFSFDLTTKDDLIACKNAMQCSFNDQLETGTIAYYRMMIEGNVANCINGILDVGLTSTQASITNNGQTTIYYEPTIQGLTKIVDANGNECQPGTAGARLVSLEPSVEGLPVLGSVPSISDTIDRASGVCTLNTKDILIQDNWKLYQSGLFMYQTINDAQVPNQNEINVLCDKVIGASYVAGSAAFSGKISFHPNKDLQYRFSEGETFEQAKLKLQGATIRYSSIPIQIQLTQEQLKAYENYKKPILLSKVGDVADKFEIREDGSGVLSDNVGEMTLKACNGITKLNENHTIFKFRIHGMKRQNDLKILGLPFNQESNTTETLNKDQEWFLVDGSAHLHISILNTKLETVSEIGMNKYLLDNLTQIVFPLETPTTTHISSLIMPTIPTDKINNLSAGGAVKASKFTASLPVDKMADVEKRLQALESVTIALS
ncbi:MAG: hypothetical protein ACRCX8_01345 [Sarcina sp.]